VKRFKPVLIRVIKPGWFTTVQDLGRHGYQQYGVPVGGAMDRHAFVLANRLVGNPDRDAALELTLKGPDLLFEQETVMAITGADLMPVLNGTVVPTWTSLQVPAGSRLAFGARRRGTRGYLAIAGGIDVPVIMGSRSTHVSSRTGGLQGRALLAGDVLVAGVPSRDMDSVIGRAVPERLRPRYATTALLRVLPGPQDDCFADGALELLTSHPYRLSSRSDRMGYRLEGPTLAHTGTGPWLSDGTAMGALQVPPDGQPILLMADRQTTGGYPKLAVVISADLHLAAQLMPGDTITFEATTLAQAQALVRAQWDELDEVLPPHVTPSA
jgi:antagonist of KipI